MAEAMHQNRAVWSAEIRAMLALAWPLVLTNVAQALINATDTVLLGWAGASTLAAGALGINLYFVPLVLGTGLIMAVSPVLAKEIGARSHSVRDVRRSVRQAMWLAAAFSIPAWILLWHAKVIFLLLGQNPLLAENAGRLLHALQWGLLPALWYLVLRSFVVALERPLWSMIVVAVTILLNAFLNYGLIFGKFGFPKLGLVGAGIGSSCANTVMFLGMVLVVSLNRRFRRYRLFGYFWQADWPRFRHLLRLGSPIAITLGFEVGIFNTAVFLMGLIGASSIAAHVVAIQIASLTFMVPLGLSQAATVRVGLAYGRRDREGIARGGWSALVLALGFMTTTALIMLLFPHALIRLFLDPADPQNAPVIPLALSFLFVAALFQIFDGAQVVGAGMLRGLHDTRVPMVFAGFGYWIVGLGTSVGLAFGLGWQGLGVWIGFVVALAVVAALMLSRWIRREPLGLIGWQEAV
jgi:MATE family multidrug resistance protein